MSSLKDRFARCWAKDLQGRVPAGHRVFPQRRPKVDGQEVQPPFTVVRVMRMEQTTPGSDAWVAEVRVVVVCDKDEGGSTEQEKRLGEIYQALEATLSPAEDDEEKVRLYGYDLYEIEEATVDKCFADVIFVTAGVGGWESSPKAAPQW